MAKHTLKILLCERRNIIKVRLAFFSIMQERFNLKLFFLKEISLKETRAEKVKLQVTFSTRF